MADVFTKEKRSDIMSRIRSKNTRLETEFLKLVSSFLYPMGFRYRKHYAKVPGKPDIAFVSKKIAIFLDGDFWHGCPKCSRPPKSNVDYWEQKIKRNRQRDKDVNKALKKIGWRVLRFWECEVKRDPDKVIKIIFSALSN